jgi:mRNA-degrading endonuclease toxin of MazEF toxin-antitoxin module
MADKAQGQIWWANLPDPLGWRPVLILTRDDALPKLHYATVAPLTRTTRDEADHRSRIRRTDRTGLIRVQFLRLQVL